MLAKIYSTSLVGIDALLVEVEVDIAKGLPSFLIVGLPDTAVKESKNRVQSAIVNSGIKFPLNKITINLAPANIKKEGSAFDLSIAIGILCAKELIPTGALSKYLFVGELSLDGSLKPVKGVLSSAITAKALGIDSIILPYENASEATAVSGIQAIGIKNLPEAIEFLNNNIKIEPARFSITSHLDKDEINNLDFSDVKGQMHVKRALEIASAGGHNIIMLGPPGSGKSMLAKRISTILPDLTIDEAIETTRIHSTLGLLKEKQPLIHIRPFRSPHHTISDAGLIGGGHIPMPGEVSISHNGVLFLDELPEFKRNVLEVMRQPMEDGIVTISRASMALSFPARFMLVAASNPCPCGYWGDNIRTCTCNHSQIKKYLSKLSGPLMDRIDIHVDVPSVPFEEMESSSCGERSEEIKIRVLKAREIQKKRFFKKNIYSNSQMSPSHVRNNCKINSNCRKLLTRAVNKLGLSARAYDKVLKVSRTISDLAGEDEITIESLAEAIQYRTLDRKNMIF